MGRDHLDFGSRSGVGGGSAGWRCAAAAATGFVSRIVCQHRAWQLCITGAVCKHMCVGERRDDLDHTCVDAKSEVRDRRRRCRICPDARTEEEFSKCI